MTAVTWENIRAFRLRRHGLLERASAARALELVPGLCGLHAQVMSSAVLTLWARVDGLDPELVPRALNEDRTLVKTWAMRGTLHLLPAAEYPLWQALMSTDRRYETPAWQRAFGATLEETEELIAVIGAALRDRLLTREQLAAAVEEATGDGAHRERVHGSWGSFLKPAAFRGALCFGPDAEPPGRKVRFTNPRTWVGLELDADPQEAMLEATRRYLALQGAVTREDLARWIGKPAAASGRLLKALGDELVPVDREGDKAFALAGELDALLAAEPPRGHVALLPAFDQYTVMSTVHCERLMPGPFRDLVWRQAGWISQVVLVDGRMDGVWRHERKGTRLIVEVEPFVKLAKRVRAGVEAEAERLADFLGCGLELSI